MIDNELKILANQADRNQSTPFQITYFLIGQEPTDQAKLQKCLQEINVRVRSIQAAEREYAELADIAQLHYLEQAKMDDSEEGIIKKRMIGRKMDAIADQIEKLDDRIAGWEKEADYIRQIYKTVNAVSPIQDWNDHNVQLEYWSAKLKQELHTRLILNMPADVEVVKTILSLPEASSVREEVLQLISHKEDK